MALDFAAQIHALSGFNADDGASGATFTANDFDETAAQWMSEGAKEIINQLPDKLLKLCASEQTFTSAAVGSEAESITTGKILSVFAGNYEAREIPNNQKHKANDADLIQYATTTDPVYYTQNGKINVLPASLSCKYDEVQYPTFTAGDAGTLDVAAATSIANFPDEAEYLVVLYAAIKGVEYMMLDEEDQEVYAPQLATLKQDYAQGLAALKGGG